MANYRAPMAGRATSGDDAKNTDEVRTEGDSADPKLAVALLRVAVGLKTQPDAGLDQLIRKATAALGIDPRHFRRYLADHMALLAQTAPEADTAQVNTSAVDSGKEEEATAESRPRPKGKTRSPVI